MYFKTVILKPEWFLHHHHPIGYLAMSSDICDIFGYHNWRIKDRNADQHPCNAQNSPHNEELWAQNGNSNKKEEPYLRGSVRHGHCIQMQQDPSLVRRGVTPVVLALQLLSGPLRICQPGQAITKTVRQMKLVCAPLLLSIFSRSNILRSSELLPLPTPPGDTITPPCLDSALSSSWPNTKQSQKQQQRTKMANW